MESHTSESVMVSFEFFLMGGYSVGVGVGVGYILASGVFSA